jgi:hypothetical protein
VWHSTLGRASADGQKPMKTQFKSLNLPEEGHTVTFMKRRHFLSTTLAAAIPWRHVRNPMLSYPQWSIKDATLVAMGGEYFLFFDAAYEDRGRLRFHVCEVRSVDLQTFSEPLLVIDGAGDGWIGMASPEIHHDGERYLLTYNSWGDAPGRPNQFFVRSSTDPVHWGAERPLAANLTNGARAIDAAVAVDHGRHFLMFKQAQTTRLAVSERLDGGYRWVGDGLPRFARGAAWGRWHENYQFFRRGGKWRLIATSGSHDPYIYTLGGDGSKESDWLNWIDGYRVEIARQDFNTADSANSGSMVLGLPEAGPQYLLFAGNTEKTSYEGRGWNRLGLARTTDMRHFSPAAVR